MPILLLLLGLGVGGAVLYRGVKSGDEKKKLIQIAQDHRARAARLQADYERCSRQLAQANPSMLPKVMAGDQQDLNEVGENPENV